VRPVSAPSEPQSPLIAARKRMMAAGQWNVRQFIGRRWPVGCVALEITQRCNLDCTACYLSEHSEIVKDLPLDEIFRRIDLIRQNFGPNTNVQVTGGDPTLRKREELIAIVRRISESGMRPALITNGIRAKRELLQELAAAGLVDVAFHIDTTQQRKGYGSEVALNAVRKDYIDRARGLPLSVMFNTTVWDGNVEEIPQLAEFFVRHSDVVRLASFQLQAATGRGVLGHRSDRLTLESVQRGLEMGVKTSMAFEALQIGHARCSRYGMVFVANGQAYDALDDPILMQKILERMPHLPLDRRSRLNAIRTFAKGVLAAPALWPRGAGWLISKLWRAKRDLMAARGRVNKLSFLVHNFMDACRLENDRITACTFMAATAAAPISMCLHNARRDSFILAPMERSNGRFWDPASGSETDQPAAKHQAIPRSSKFAKGRKKTIDGR
jgi:pyruvate-formate lyase-activating enzyme